MGELAKEASARQQAKLRALGGGTVPSDVAGDASALAQVGDEALAPLQPLLCAVATQPMSEKLGQQLADHCGEHGLDNDALSQLLRACRWLLHSAASTDLAAEALAADIVALWPEPRGLRDLLLQSYDIVRPTLREALLAHALLKHGNVLDQVEWRVDRVAADARAPHLNLPVALVTFSYKKRHRSKELTLQLTTNQLRRTAHMLSSLADQTERMQAPSARPVDASASTTTKPDDGSA